MISNRLGLLAVALFLAIGAGCAKNANKPAAAGSGISEEEGVQIGDLVDVPELSPQFVEGYGIVAGLGENGSAECPMDVMGYLRRYTRVMMPESTEDPEKLIRSLDTAVVKVQGSIKPGTRKGKRYDIIMKPIQGSQTRSLAGGQLYTTDLMQPGRALAGATALGTAAGPVFIDTLGGTVDNRTGYVLGGGSSNMDYPMTIRLKKPDFKMSSALRNRVIQRFGSETATTRSEGEIALNPPVRFADSQAEFIALVKALYVVENDQLNKRRAEILAKRLIDGQDRQKAEAALIGLGRISSTQVAGLLRSQDEEVRLRSARVMLSYKEYGALDVLRGIVYDPKSKWRLEALNAVVRYAPDEQTSGVLSKLVNDPEPTIRLAAEEEIVRCGSPLVQRENIGGRFFLDIVNSSGPAMIYATRTGGPRIILFGQDISAQGDIFMTAADGSVTLNSKVGLDTVTIIRSRRGETGVVGMPLTTGRLVSDIIRTLSTSPVVDGKKVQMTGLSIAYSDTLELLKMLCEKGHVKAQFAVGPMERPGEQ
jgi:flagellar basal body P-ring protein FlgI